MTSKAENQRLFGVPGNSMVYAKAVRKSVASKELVKSATAIDTDFPPVG